MRAQATDFYKRMTNYNIIVFTFLWCDLAQEIARVHKNIQRKDLQISDVDRFIALLCFYLKEEYPLDCEILDMYLPLS